MALVCKTRNTGSIPVVFSKVEKLNLLFLLLFIVMKWSKEKDEELRTLAKSGKRHSEIAKLNKYENRNSNFKSRNYQERL